MAVVILETALPYFNQLSGKELITNYFDHWLLPVSALFMILVVGLLAGSYPAFYLSKFKPIAVLKSKLSDRGGHSFMRGTLVVFQFAISFFMIVSTLVVRNQLEYIQNKKLGFNKEQVILVQDAYMLDKQLLPFKEEMLKNPLVESSSISNFLPVNSSRSNSSHWPQGMTDERLRPS